MRRQIVRTLGCGKAFQDYLAREGCDQTQVVTCSPAGIEGVGCAGERSSGNPAKVIDQNIVKLNLAIVIASNTVEDLNDRERLDDEAGFFENFTTDAILKPFA